MQSTSGQGLHIAIIMDGNGRWATRRGLPRMAGHRAGLSAARRIVEHASDIGVRALTLYAFSSDNCRRPAAEVRSIFWLLRAFLRMETERMRDRGARLQVIGRRDRLPEPVLRSIEKSEWRTAAGRGIHLRVAIDYSSRDAITLAAAEAHKTAGAEASCDELRHALMHALTGNAGDVDLLIRTGGEKRLSDFLLWESAYAELLFTDRMWPDFDDADLDSAIEEFQHRERRFGGVPASVPVVSIAGGAR